MLSVVHGPCLSWTILYKHIGILLHLYNSLVRPDLEYCISAWSPYYKKDKILIEKVKRRFTRMIPSAKPLPYEDRLEQLNLWSSLEDRRAEPTSSKYSRLFMDYRLSNFVFFSNILPVIVQGAIPWSWPRNVQDWTCGSTSSVNELHLK